MEERDKAIVEIDEHRQQIDWRQSMVETLIDEIAELSALLNDGSGPISGEERRTDG